MAALRQVETSTQSRHTHQTTIQQQFILNTQTPTQQNTIFLNPKTPPLTLLWGVPLETNVKWIRLLLCINGPSNEARGGSLPLTPPSPLLTIFLIDYTNFCLLF